jgi:SOS-response transcriptional repressor LexA
MCPESRNWAGELTKRIREVRISTCGPRGRARFARALGVSPSTYNYYERGRIPPMPVLLKMSEVAGVDLRWLLTGDWPPGSPGNTIAPGHAKILARMSAILPERAEAAAALNALLDLLETQPRTTGSATGPTRSGVTPRAVARSPRRIPVLGRTAAGVPHFWSRGPESVDLLASALARTASTGRSLPLTLTGPEEASTLDVDPQARLVQVTKPVRVAELEIAEFVECPGLPDAWRNAFALRIDGDSMHPALSHGDLVIVSPSQSATSGHAAVVQLRDQIGVTCKLFYRDRKRVRLIPINEQFQPTSHPLKDLVWALAVGYRVRLSE